MSAVEFELANLQDRNTIYQLHIDSVTTLCASSYSKAQIEGWFVGRTPDDYMGAIEYGGVWIAVLEGEPVGFVEVFPGLISMMFVAGRFARAGVGKQLMHFALRQAEQGVKGPIHLKSTLNAEGFYKKFGFRKTGEGKLHRESGIELPVVLMEKVPHRQ